MASPATHAARPWADLPTEIVDAVVSHLDIFGAAKLSTVCTSWAKAIATNHSLPFGMPCLLSSRSDEQCTFELEKFCTTRHVDSAPPDTAYVEALRDQRWVGAKGNWIVTMDNQKYCNARLINPYTNVQIELPPVSTLPDIDLSCYIGFCNVISRIVLCETPSPDASGDGAYLAVAFVVHVDRFLAIARGGDQFWTILKNNEDNQRIKYHDVIMHKGKVIAITEDGDLSVWNIRGSQDHILDEPELLPGPKIKLDDKYFVEQYYLAEIADGQRLLLACTFSSQSTYCRRVFMSFKYETVEGSEVEGMLLYELDIDDADGSDSWRRVTSLGNQSLFLGVNYPLCVSFQVSRNVPLWLQHARPDCNCEPEDRWRWQLVRPNCVIIAFTNNRFSRDPFDGAVYDLAHETYNSVKWSWADNKVSSYQDPMWFIPTLRDCWQSAKADL